MARRQLRAFFVKELLSNHTTFQLGGPCREWAEVADAAGARERILSWNAASVPWRTMGGGSNLLVADEGIEEAVLCFRSDKPAISVESESISAMASTSLDEIARMAAHEGWEGLGFASGIPGTLGGAICGNAGAFGKSMGQVVERIECLDRYGRAVVLSGDELGFEYRASSIQNMGLVIVRAWLRLCPGDRDKLLAERDEILAARRSKHPDWKQVPTAGSFFKNLPPASAGGMRRAAGLFLDAIGARQMSFGRARVFEKHANILIAERGAKAGDVRDLAIKMAKAVYDRFGFALEPEVQMWGFAHNWPDFFQTR